MMYSIVQDFCQKFRTYSGKIVLETALLQFFKKLTYTFTLILAPADGFA